MSEFKPIETQEELDSIISKRLERERKKLAENYADYEELKDYKSKSESQIADVTKALDEANQKLSSHDAEVEELNAKIKGYETKATKVRLAQEVGLDISLADRINGEDEESMRADAEILAKAFKQPTPLASVEKEPSSERDDGLRKMLKDLGGN